MTWNRHSGVGRISTDCTAARLGGHHDPNADQVVIPLLFDAEAVPIHTYCTPGGAVRSGPDGVSAGQRSIGHE
jgi:hypothetical protein